MVAPDETAESLRDTMLRISELARRTGASRATIQHYLREGLLPAPVKTGRTMAYYDPACVQRIRMIKELQRRYLPLGVIRDLVEASDREVAGKRGLMAMAAAGEQIRTALQPAERPIARDEVAAQTQVDAETLAALEKLGIVRAERVWNQDVFGPADAAILRAVGRLQAAGVTKEVGFRVADLRMYRDAMQGLLSKEIAAFGRSVGKRAPEDVVRLGIAAATGATDLLVAIRSKLIADFVASATGGKRRGRHGKR